MIKQLDQEHSEFLYLLRNTPDWREARLTPTMVDIVEKYYLLDKSYTHQEIGEKLGISKQRVHDLRQQAVDIIKNYDNEKNTDLTSQEHSRVFSLLEVTPDWREAKLTPMMVEIIEKYYLLDKSYTHLEIAGRLGISVKRVHNLKDRAIAIIEDYVNNKGKVPPKDCSEAIKHITTKYSAHVLAELLGITAQAVYYWKINPHVKIKPPIWAKIKDLMVEDLTA